MSFWNVHCYEYYAFSSATLPGNLDHPTIHFINYYPRKLISTLEEDATGAKVLSMVEDQEKV